MNDEVATTPGTAAAAPPPTAVSGFFIVGAPRTGSTLLRRLLSAHPAIAIPLESGFWADYLRAEHVPLAVRKRLLVNEPELAYWGERPTLAELEPLPTMAACMAYTHQRYAAAQGKHIWGQKTPKLVRCGDLLLELFPTARLVHTVRDPRAVAGSLKHSQAHRLHVGYGTRRYVADTLLGLELEQRYPNRVLRVTYEDLVRDPSTTLSTICAWLGVPYDAAMIASATTVSLTPKEQRLGHHANVHRPVNDTSVEAWRSTLSAREVNWVEYLAGPLLQTLGYTPVYASPKPPTAAERLQAACIHGWTSLHKALLELRRPDVVAIARRRYQLGSLGRMLREHMRGL